MHILICDDDAVFAARVETLVRDFFALRGLQVECTVCHSGEETLARRDLDLYQVALLDVDLDTMNGISLGKQLRQCSPEICLVYVSAYLEFAPEGYTVNAFRYILSEVQAVCQQILILSKGHLAAAGSLEELTADGKSLEEVFLELTDGEPEEATGEEDSE